MAFHPEDRVVASCSEDKSIKLWNLDDGGLLSTMKAHSDCVRAVAWSPCGQWLASGGDDSMIFIYDTNTFEVKSSLRGHSTSVNCVDFSPDGLTIASGSGVPFGGDDNSVRVWDVKTGKQLWQLNVDSAVWSVRFSPAGDIVAAGCDDGTVQLIDVATQCLETFLARARPGQESLT